MNTEILDFLLESYEDTNNPEYLYQINRILTEADYIISIKRDDPGWVKGSQAAILGTSSVLKDNDVANWIKRKLRDRKYNKQMKNAGMLKKAYLRFKKRANYAGFYDS